MILDKIVQVKKEEIAALKKPNHPLQAKLAEPDLSLLAEIKKASPSKGLIKANFQPIKQLQAYQKAGAAAISVLTDQQFFQGSTEILAQVRQATDLPVLRKEFIIDAIQVYQSLFLGADVILLIAAILSQQQLEKLLSLSRELGLEAIVEVHTAAELARVMATEAKIIGINNRNLHDFTVTLQTTVELLNIIKNKGQRANYYIIAESGIKTKADISYLKDLGVDGVLIGETLMRASDPIKKVKELGIS
jgi:indole-3-glycerol phosphate synthase